MTLQFHPIALGLMLVVAVGTAAYALWNSSSSREQCYDQHRVYDYYSTTIPSSSDTSNNGARKRTRKEKDDKEQCTICLHQMENSLLILSCGHIFHKSCISRWLRLNSTCPICREIVEKARKLSDGKERCTICLVQLEKNVKSLSCGHNFHNRCISTWLFSNDTCPNCRKINENL